MQQMAYRRDGEKERNNMNNCTYYYLRNSVTSICKRIRNSTDYNYSKDTIITTVNILTALYASNTISTDMYRYLKNKLNNAFVDGGFASTWQVQEFGMIVSRSRRKIF